MNRRDAGRAVGLVIGAVVLIGAGLTWQAYRQWMAFGSMEGHMGMDAGIVHGMHPGWYLLGTLIAAGSLGLAYLVIRPQLVEDSDEPSRTGSQDRGNDLSGVPGGPTGSPTEADQVMDRRPTILEVLPQDERRVLKPVIESPGVTQIELRDRSEYSKSKVSQTVSSLEKRGLLYREPQGRTFRVYPASEIEDLDPRLDEAKGGTS